MLRVSRWTKGRHDIDKFRCLQFGVSLWERSLSFETHNDLLIGVKKVLDDSVIVYSSSSPTRQAAVHRGVQLGDFRSVWIHAVLRLEQWSAGVVVPASEFVMAVPNLQIRNFLHI